MNVSSSAQRFRDQIYWQASDRLGDKIRFLVLSQEIYLYGQLHDQLYWRLDNQLDGQLRVQLEDQLRKRLI